MWNPTKLSKKCSEEAERASTAARLRDKVREDRTKVTRKLDSGFTQLFGLLDATLDELKKASVDPVVHKSK